VEAMTISNWHDVTEHHDIHFINCNFEGDLYPVPQFERCCFDKCIFGTVRTRLINQDNKKFVNRDILKCDFRIVTLSGIIFDNCTFLHSKFNHSTTFEQIRLVQPRGLETNENLHVVRTEANSQLDEDLANAPLPLIEKIASWERLRTFGRLPLFGVSFST